MSGYLSGCEPQPLTTACCPAPSSEHLIHILNGLG
jgi:hypothetical protein